MGLGLMPFSAVLGVLPILVMSLVLLGQRFSVLRRQRLNWIFAALSLWLLLSAGFSVNRAASYLGVFNFIPFFIAFASLSLLIQTIDQIRRIIWIFVLASIPVSLLGLAQFLPWGNSGSLLGGVIIWDIAPLGNPPGRMASVFNYATVLASYNVVIFALSLGLGLAECKAKTKGWIIAAAVLNAIALVLTNSRNAWAIALITCLAFALYKGWRLIVGAVTSLSTVVLAAAFAPPAIANLCRIVVPRFFWARLNDELYADRPVEQLRATQWRFALKLTEQRPVTGWGLRTFGDLYTAYARYSIPHPHNLLLMLLCETGIPGTLLLFGGVGWILGQSVMHMQNGIFSSHHRTIYVTLLFAFGTCTLFSFLDIPLFDARINLMGWILLAAIAGPLHFRQAIE